MDDVGQQERPGFLEVAAWRSQSKKEKRRREYSTCLSTTMGLGQEF